MEKKTIKEEKSEEKNVVRAGFEQDPQITDPALNPLG